MTTGTPRVTIAAMRGWAAGALVGHALAPLPSADVRVIVLLPADDRPLAAFIRADIVAGGAPRAGYGGYDVFYPARGRYGAAHDCNAWVGDALRAASVRVG